ncbi:MAG: type II toxin-antitoxin system HicB family antitoxin [Clostridia bacterium]|nr:type II toxin-antitoxin system HicB family antitoxin [Clostridia bacterium]
MKKFVYPAVVYYDEDNKIYVAYIEELGLVAEGKTMEEVHNRIEEYLFQYLYTSISFDMEIPTPTSFESVQNKYSKNKVVLVGAQLDIQEIKKRT